MIVHPQTTLISSIFLLLLEFPLDIVCYIEDAMRWRITHKALCALDVVLQGACFTEVVLTPREHWICYLFPGLPADVACEWQAIILIFASLLVSISPLCFLEPLLPLIPLLHVQDAVS